jgi:NAD(P)-dependent dehydrogenase (short-subunit alcohol dehydrogenase family)
VDVADRRSIRSFAAEVAGRYPRLDGLVNNAGAWFPDRRAGADGVELTWATNVLGPFLLTRLLEEPLARAHGRVINVGSHLASGLDLDDVGYARRKYVGFDGAYPQSKQALLMLSHHEARRLWARGVTLNVAEPEWVRTNAHRHANPIQRFVMNLAGSIAARTPAEGADTAVWLASAPELAGVTGGDFKDRQRLPPRFAGDAQAIARLCSLCEAQVGLGGDRGLSAA